MSEQAVDDFLERMKTDEVFRARVLAVHDVDERLTLVRAEGYDCTAADIGRHGEPLDDETLEHIAAAGESSQICGWDY